MKAIPKAGITSQNKSHTAESRMLLYSHLKSQLTILYLFGAGRMIKALKFNYNYGTLSNFQKMNANQHQRYRTKETRTQHPHLVQKRVSPTAQTGSPLMTVEDKGWAGSGQHYKDDQLVLFPSLVLLKDGQCAKYFKAPTH